MLSTSVFLSDTSQVAPSRVPHPWHGFSLWLLSCWLLSTFQSLSEPRQPRLQPKARPVAPPTRPHDSGPRQAPALLALTRKGGQGKGGSVVTSQSKGIKTALELKTRNLTAQPVFPETPGLTFAEIWSQNPTASRPAHGEKALALTGNQGIEAAMDWLMEHEDDPDVDKPLPTPLGHVLGREPTSSEQGGPEGPDRGARCGCGGARGDAGGDADGLFAGPGSPAEEGKLVLSEEERQEQTKRHVGGTALRVGGSPCASLRAQSDQMLELVAQKQREREEREEREALERERRRRRQGQELSAARQRLQEDEMRRAAEERRREKAEELAARQRVREKIERDKAERAKKYGGSVSSPPSAPAEPGSVPSSPSQEPPSKREYDQCRIQVRLPDGTSLTQTFRAREQLAAVRLYVELHRGEEPGGDQDPVQLLSGFPRRAFSEADMERPLQELGLVPSAVLIVAKKCPS
ncbi:UBX domain-containing protein 1 [Myotis davidii]|uniref:UBX domain-containing protein 1 n=1 Tax=Myotis davidii TaxID=225400 RepID=L5LBR3_MYODS|nr:UBX domain-containing protein 1 [Myotis davidii]